ncbi:MAG: DUF5996 family protein [Anaerolineales bacterium]
MSSKDQFPSLVGWRGTRNTLHAYVKVLGEIRASFTPEQPRFKNIGLRLYTAGLTTTPIPHPTDKKRHFALSMDLRNHYILLSTSEGEVQQFRMSEGLSATKMGDQLLARMAELGISGNVNKSRFENNDEREYALDKAENYFTALSHIGRIFDDFRAELDGEPDPVQFWPHHFDLAFILLGDKKVKTVDGEYPSQITFGYAPDDPGQPSSYFYATPFPFEESVTEEQLPDKGVWHTAIWQGALLPYEEIAGDPDAEKRILAFLRGAYQIEKGLI